MTRIVNTKTDAVWLGGGKLPPQDKEVEAALLGLLLIESHATDQVLPVLSIDDFYDPAHAKIYNAVVKLHTKGGMVDLLTITDELRKSDELELIGGPYFLTKLTMSVVSSAHLMAWALIIKEHSIKRTIIRIAGQLYNDGFAAGTDALDLLSKAQLELSRIQDSFRSQKMRSFGEVVIETLMEMEEASKSDNPYLGLKMGLECIDSKTLGFAPSDFIIMAGGTGEGKSTLALQAAEYIGTSGDGVGFFSLEMKDRQLIWKVFSSLIEEEVNTIRKGKLSPEKWKLLHQIINDKLMQANIWMHDQGGITIEELVGIIRTLVAKKGVKIVFIDYLQLIRTTQKFGTRDAEVGYVSRTLKALAMELNICIVALSQLSRIKGEKRLYRLSDLRESGSIEQDANGVIMVWRPKYHDVEKLKPTDPPFEDDDVLFQIEKWRLGNTGWVKGKFNGKWSRFEDPEAYNRFRPLNEVLAEQKVIFQQKQEAESSGGGEDAPF